MNWIKVPCDLPESLEVIRISRMVGIEWAATVGKLIRIWCWFDKYGTDWSAEIPSSFIDDFVSCHGFVEALKNVGWLYEQGDFVSITSPDSLCGCSPRRPMKVQSDVSDFAAQLYANGKRCGQPISQKQWDAVLLHFEFSCAYCRAVGVPLTIEHLTPVSRGGGNEVGNIVPACESCNYSKGDRFPLEWFFARKEA